MSPKSEMVGIRKLCYRICKFAIYVGCILGFWFNTVAIFHDWWADTTMVSTKVVKAPDNSLETPILLICNTSAYKNPVLEINTDSYKNNTMSFRDAFKCPNKVEQHSATSMTIRINTVIQKKLHFRSIMFSNSI